MPDPKPLFDRSALERSRNRSRRLGFAGFLHDEAVFEIKERLADINRSFMAPAIVTGFPEIWGKAFPDARLIEDRETLNFESQAHDLVIHAMCLHTANDPLGQIIQCRRALRPDGVFLAAVPGGQSLHELRSCLAAAEIAECGGLSPRVAPMAEIRDLGGLLQRGGLALPVADCVPRLVSYRDLFALMADLRAMGETNSLISRQKTFTKRNLFREAARIYQDSFSDGDGRLCATFELIFLTGWAPDESQQQPLKPGSAKTRLADFLNTTELGADAKPVKDAEGKKK